MVALKDLRLNLENSRILDDNYNECSDTNSDGIINILDVVTLVNFIFSSP